MSYYRFFPFRDDYYHHGGRHHDEGIVNNLIVNVQEQYTPRYPVHYVNASCVPFFREFREGQTQSFLGQQTSGVGGIVGGVGGNLL